MKTERFEILAENKPMSNSDIILRERVSLLRIDFSELGRAADCGLRIEQQKQTTPFGAASAVAVKFRNPKFEIRIITLLAAVLVIGLAMPAVAQSTTEPAVPLATSVPTTLPTTAPASMPADVSISIPGLKTPDEVSGTLKWILLATALSVAPAVLVLVTCFTRIIVVLGLLRAALATPQLPPNQVIFGLALLMTVVVMMPTGTKVYKDAVEPYMSGRISQTQALTTAEGHARAFMIRQIDAANNEEDVFLFMSEPDAKSVKAWKDVPTTAMIPGFVVSELKVAFSMGFRFFLPFLIIDMLIASVLVSMGMLMVPPVLISLPFKLLLFVLADGWHLVIGTLMTSFG